MRPELWEELPHFLQTDGGFSQKARQKIAIIETFIFFADVWRESASVRRGVEEGLRWEDGREGRGDLQDPLWNHLWDQVLNQNCGFRFSKKYF